MTVEAVISRTKVPEGYLGPMHMECYSLFGRLGGVLNINAASLRLIPYILELLFQ